MAPTVEQWNAQKKVVIALYRTLKLSDVKKRMEKKHGFIAGLSTYQKKLKEWGEHKNIPHEQWDLILREDGKGKEVHLHNRAIPKKKIDKEKQRRTLTDLKRISSPYPNAPSPEAPEGIFVSTPPSAIREGFMGEIQTDNLPYFGLMDLITSQGNLGDLGGFGAFAPSECVSLPEVFSTPRISNDEEGVVSSECAAGEFVAGTQRTGVSGDFVSAMNSGAIYMTITRYANPNRKDYFRLRASLPEQFDRELIASAKDFPRFAELGQTAQVLFLAMYLISNNMLEDEDFGKVIKCFELERFQRLLEPLLSVKASSVDAFAENRIRARAKVPIAIEELPKAGRTDLPAAAENGYVEFVRHILLYGGADVNTSVARTTALQVSAIKGYVGIAKMLLDAGADVNAPAALEYGRTALEGAAEHGRIDMVQLLLNAGARLCGPGDAQYRKAMDLAKENGHQTVRQLIKNHYESGGNK